MRLQAYDRETDPYRPMSSSTGAETQPGSEAEHGVSQRGMSRSNTNSHGGVPQHRGPANLRCGGSNPTAASRLHTCLQEEATEFFPKPSAFMVRCGLSSHGSWHRKGFNVLCSVVSLLVVVSTMGCTSLRPHSRTATESPGIVEEDLSDSSRRPDGTLSQGQAPGELIRPKTPGSEGTSTGTRNADRPPRRLIWREGQVSKPGWEAGEGSKPEPVGRSAPRVR